VVSAQRRIVAVDPSSPGAIQRAVASLEDGGVVFLAPGSYTIESTVELRSHIAVVGSGAHSTTITLAPGSNCHAFTNVAQGKGDQEIELRGFRLEGNMRDQHKPPDHKPITFACGGYFKRVTGLRVHDVVASGIRQTAFHFNHSTHVLIDGLEADELGWSGVSTSGTDDIVLRRVVVTNSGLDVRHSGIHLDGGVGAHVEAVIDGCTGNGIMIDSKFSPMSDVVVRGVGRRALRGLSLSGAQEHPLTNVCASGDYSDNRECGILVSNASNVFIVDATIASNGQAGLVIQGKGGSTHCVMARSRITASPKLVVERDDNRIAYITESALVPLMADAEMLASPDTESAGTPRKAPMPPAQPATAAPPAARPLRQRVRRKVSRGLARARRKPAPAKKPKPPAPPPPSTADPAVPEDDSYDGTCNVCGTDQTFVRRHRWMREGYRCATCKASLRYRGQADALLRAYARHGATTLAELTREPEFTGLDLWEPGVLGPFRDHFSAMPGYVVSDFWPDVRPGDARDGVRCEDLMALSFASESFDVVVTSDIFEHIRRPFVAFAEVHRVLRPGGRHVFSVPIPDPWFDATVERVDTSGDEDVVLLEPKYHLGPHGSHHIVYNNFGRDLVDRLAGLGFDTDVLRTGVPSREKRLLVTFSSSKR
jgi:SAM-dependent methyltransferase